MPSSELEKIVEQGPDPARDGVVHWRRVDLQGLIKARFDVDLHERSVGKLLRRLGFTRLVGPPHAIPIAWGPQGTARAPRERSRGARDVQKGFSDLVREVIGLGPIPPEIPCSRSSSFRGGIEWLLRADDGVRMDEELAGDRDKDDLGWACRRP